MSRISKLLAKLEPSPGGVSLFQSKDIPESPGMYIVNSGNCISHIGQGGNIRNRTGALRRLGTHRGSDEVLCGAYCTGKSPMLHWVVMEGSEEKARRGKEIEMEKLFGSPPTPRPEFEKCVHGKRLCDVLIQNSKGWQRGYILASFEIGEQMGHIFHSSFDKTWSRVGKPAGWDDFTFSGILNHTLPQRGRRE